MKNTQEYKNAIKKRAGAIKEALDNLEENISDDGCEEISTAKNNLADCQRDIDFIDRWLPKLEEAIFENQSEPPAQSEVAST